MDKKHRCHEHGGNEETGDNQIASGFRAAMCALEYTIARHAAEEIPERAREKNAEREERRAGQLQLVAVKEVRWNPCQKKPERPPVTEIHERHWENPHRKPAERYARSRLHALLGQSLEICGADALVLRGIVPEIYPPHHRPKETRHANNHERSAPGCEQNQIGHEQRRYRVAESRKRMSDALSEAALLRRCPVRHRAGRYRQCRDADSEQHTGDEHAGNNRPQLWHVYAEAP